MNSFKSFLKKRKKLVIVFSIVAVSIVSFSFVEDYYFEVSKNLDIFTTTYRNVNIYYVDSIQPGALMEKGINSMLKTLDPYTVYIPESDIEDYKMTHISAEYGGIGALVHERNGEIEVSEVYEGFPAQKNDIRPGDKILAVNGTSVARKDVGDVTEYLKGAKGSKVSLTLKREGEEKPLEKNLYRDEIKFKNVPYFGMVSPNTGYIRLNQFLEDAGEEVGSAFTALKANPGMKYLVLDLRGNGGGLLKEAVEIVNLFVDKGEKIVSQKGKVREMNMEYIATKPPLDVQIPVAVLVDKGSASAAEIVTGALQELDRGVVIGQRTFGKGLVQQTYPMSYNTLLKVTIAKYYTPSGRCIQALDYAHRSNTGIAGHHVDSLLKEFKTKNGRSVYDGSGVYPDVYLEQMQYSNISGALAMNYLIFDYANEYFRSHPTIDSASKFHLSDAEFADFTRWLSDKKYDYTNKSEHKLDDLKEAAEKEKYFSSLEGEFNALKKKMEDQKKLDVKNHAEEIREILEAEIVSRYYYESGALQSNFKYDRELKKAIEVLNDNKTYTAILSGEGEHKIIGKPGTTEQALTGSESEDWGEKN
jgi:carboxyl-terminal processing protease